MSGRKLEGKIYKRALFLAAGVALGALGVAAPAYAQDEDEIVVTAQRRVERQIEVPISLTALTGDQLDRAGIDNVQELAQVTPGFIATGRATARTIQSVWPLILPTPRSVTSI